MGNSNQIKIIPLNNLKIILKIILNHLIHNVKMAIVVFMGNFNNHNINHLNPIDHLN